MIEYVIWLVCVCVVLGSALVIVQCLVDLFGAVGESFEDLLS